MKKVLALIAIMALVFTFMGCGAKEQGVLNIGITDYPPLNYYEKGVLIGFETEFTKEVCKELGLTPNFIEIDWGSKEMELQSRNIDIIWNGMTWTEERAQNMLLSDRYLNNGGVLVVKKGVQFNPDTDSIAVEKGAQAERVIDSDPYFTNTQKVKVDSMTKGFLEVASGNVTATYCDYIAARGMMTEGSDYTNLEIWNGFEEFGDNFALGFRKDDVELCQKINNIMAEMKADGRMKAIAEKYGLGDLL